ATRVRPTFPTRRSSDLRVRAIDDSPTGELVPRSDVSEQVVPRRHGWLLLGTSGRQDQPLLLRGPTEGAPHGRLMLATVVPAPTRSEEHTSELQSRENLV